MTLPATEEPGMLLENESKLFKEDDTLDQILRANDAKTLAYIPVIVFLSILMIVGTLGNVVVLYVYLVKFQRASVRHFIVSLSILDLLACTVGIPIEIYNLVHSLTFEYSFICKVLRVTEVMIACGSVFILLVIGIDRYIKICKPTMNMNVRTAKIMCITAGLSGSFMSVPASMLFGISRTPIGINDTKGHTCDFEETYKDSAFRQIYYLALGLIFLITFVSMSGMYIQIWVVIKRRRGKKTVLRAQSMTVPMTNLNDRLSAAPPEESSIVPKENEADNPKCKKNIFNFAGSSKKGKISRSAVILFTVTVVFALSYLPSLIVNICYAALEDESRTQRHFEDMVGKFFMDFYFVNNAINPVIYSL
ncbi:hypothetical protein ACJMK2_017159 [Sinanodonta woodiana]|uniref:G-protein coupled receptors family 1 profile domain-containing protein n=1 Tax=Sinanodonta woodiana TaxID=1069815 RepID=A0ABD3UYP1_SINWO